MHVFVIASLSKVRSLTGSRSQTSGSDTNARMAYFAPDPNSWRLIRLPSEFEYNTPGHRYSPLYSTRPVVALGSINGVSHAG